MPLISEPTTSFFTPEVVFLSAVNVPELISSREKEQLYNISVSGSLDYSSAAGTIPSWGHPSKEEHFENIPVGGAV